MDTFIYIGLGFQLLPQAVDVWVDALMSRITIKGLSSQLCILYGRYLFQAPPYVMSATCLLEHISLKKLLIFMSAFHIPFGNKSW